MMESIECPVPDCTYATPANTDAIVVAALLNAHATTHYPLQRHLRKSRKG